MNDDPFATDEEDDRTVLRPRTGAAGSRPEPPRHTGGVASDITRLPLFGGISPLENAASRLLPLLVSIGRSTTEPDVARLRDSLMREIEAFKRRAHEVLEEPAQATQASYVLCSALDEAVMHTPWGHRANWAQHSLLEHFHEELNGGERFFSLLKNLGREPERNRSVLELMYLLLALGYQGAYRIARDGQATLVRVREWLYAALTRDAEPDKQPLSPHWRGSAVAERTLPRFAAALLVALLALAVAIAVRVTIKLDTGTRAEQAVGSFYPLKSAPFLSAAVAAPAPRPVPAGAAPAGPTLSELLALDIAAGALVVDDDMRRGRIRIVGDALFGSGRADVAPETVPLLARVGRALGQFEGDVVVSGHTDSVPVRSGRWASNLELSLARAEAVLAELAPSLPPARAARAEGRGSLEPLNDNATSALQRDNRRVDVTIEYNSGGAR